MGARPKDLDDNLHFFPPPNSGDKSTAVQRPGDHRGSRSSTPPAIRTLLRDLGLRPQKGFGQNFLTDEGTLARIARAGNLTPNDDVLEIGPGLGHLTHHLAREAKRVVAIEIDRGLTKALRDIFADVPNVEIVEGDALKVDPGTLFDQHPYKLVANLPYYITAPALRHYLEASNPPTVMVVLVQKEVAYRILAKPGDMSLLAVSVQVYGQVHFIGRIAPSAFFPPPKVESAILRIDVREKPLTSIDPEKFFKVVAAGFSGPRKQIHNALSQQLWMPPGAASDALTAAGIDPARRAQTLSIQEWSRLATELEERGLL